MDKILVTGGTGLLGREIVRQLILQNQPVGIFTTQPEPVVPRQAKVYTGDLISGAGLHEAVKHCKIVIHCASNPRAFQQTDMLGTQNLLQAMHRNSASHLVYISIVGIDKSDYPYYAAKKEVENAIAKSGIPFTILRTAQFHHFVYNLIQGLLDPSRDVFEIPNGMKFQSIDIREVAEKLIDIAKDKPKGLLPNFCGPQILAFEEYVRQYLDLAKKTIKWNAAPLRGPRYDLFRSGINLCAAHPSGKITWADFISKGV